MKKQTQRSRKVTRLFSIVLMLTMVVMLLPMNNVKVHAAETIPGSSLLWELNSGTLTITGTGPMPSYEYNEGSRPWHSNISNINTITIEEGVETIGDWAFYEAENLTSLTIPSTIKEIGKKAFQGCNNLTAASFPESLEKIASLAFHKCAKIENITIPESVTTIGDDAFSWCSSLKSAVVKGNVTTLSGTFGSCANLESVTLPETLTTIGMSCFSGDTKLQSITLPNTVTTINGFAFYNSGLTSITIPSKVESIGNSAFNKCSSLTSVEFKGTVGTDGSGIAADAFSGVGTTGADKTTLKLPAGMTGPASNAAAWHGGYFKLLPNHTHNSDAYGFNDTEHWKKCTDDDTEAAGTRANHSFEWKTDVAATATTDGKKHEECSVCKYKRNENTVIPAGGKDDGNGGNNVAQPDTTLNTTTPVEDPKANEVKDITPVVKNDLSAAVASGMDAIIFKGLSDAEKEAGVWSWMELKVVENNKANSSDAGKINAVLAKNSKVGTYFDIKIFKQVSGLDKQRISTLPENITISIIVPEALRKAGRNFEIVYVHENNAAKSIKPLSYNASTGELKFEAREFSTYALVYNDTNSVVTSSSTATSAKTGEITRYAGLIIMVSTMLLALGFFVRRRRNF